MRPIKHLFSLAAAASLLTLAPIAISNDHFYQGKTIQMVVGYSAGGGYDTFARVVARHIGKHIPGNPNVVIQNVPGAGSLVAMNQLVNTMPQDGTYIGSIARGLPYEPLFGNTQAQYDPLAVNWLGSVASEVSLCVVSTNSGIETYQDLYTQPLLVGATGSGGDSNVFPRVLADTMGFQMNVVAGYPGSADILLALERGEVQSICSWSYSSNKDTRDRLVENGDARVIFQMAINKHPELPEVPLILDLAETEAQRQALTLLFGRQQMGRPFMTGPGVPEERVRILKAALEATTRDPEFLADAAAQSLEIDWFSGDDIERLIAEAYTYPEEVVQVLLDAM